jgi:hypothetical protein
LQAANPTAPNISKTRAKSGEQLERIDLAGAIAKTVSDPRTKTLEKLDMPECMTTFPPRPFISILVSAAQHKSEVGEPTIPLKGQT